MERKCQERKRENERNGQYLLGKKESESEERDDRERFVGWEGKMESLNNFGGK